MKGIIEISDPKTGLSHFEPMHSFVGNFASKLLKVFLGVYGGWTVKNRNRDEWASDTFKVACNSNATNNGILVGSGDTAVSLSDYCLDTQLSITYGATMISDVHTVSGLRCITVFRTVTNNTEDPVTIKEIGLFCYSGNSSHPHLLARDVLSSPLTLDPDEGKVVKFHLGITNNFTDNFLHFLRSRFLDDSVSLLDTSGTERSKKFDSSSVLYAASGTKDRGLVIGVGKNAFSFSDYCVQTPTQANIDYLVVVQGTHSFSVPNGTAKIQAKRSFLNTSGTIKNVTELGLIIYDTYKFLIARYVFSEILFGDDQLANFFWNVQTSITPYEPPSPPGE